MKKKKILVLGSSGFLGSHLTNILLSNGHDVIQFDSIPPAKQNSDSQFILGSILNMGHLQKAMSGIDIVYHFAAMTDIDIVEQNPAQAIEVNIAGTTNVLEASIQENVKRIIFSSSVYVYSEYGGVYKSTKQACELLIEDYFNMHGLPYTILQLGSAYGPGAKKTNLIGKFIKEALNNNQIIHDGNGEEIRQYIYVEDVARTAMALMEEKYMGKKVILLGTEKIKISELMAEIQSQINRNIKLVFNQDDYGIHYKETPFSTEPNGAIFFDSTNGVPIKKGIEKTITSAKIEIGI